MSSVNKHSFVFPFQPGCFLISFSFIIVLAMSSSTMLNRGGRSGYSSLVPYLKRESIWSLIIMCDMSYRRRRQWHPTPILLPGKPHGWRSLEGCSPWGRWESDMTERLHFHFSLSRIGEGNGNPLQCSCLENPRDGGAWWAAVYRVAQSRTWLKWLSSSSSMSYRDFGLFLCVWEGGMWHAEY